MSYASGYMERRIAAEASADARAAFIRRTYAHLAGAILAFVGLETLLVTQVPEDIIRGMFGGRGGMIICLLAFMGVAWLANYWAMSSTSRLMQYAGLGLYVALEAVIFLPLLYYAAYYVQDDVIKKAGILTLTMFGGLTFVVFVTRSDFSFLRAFLCLAGFVAVGLVIVAALFGIGLGMWFSVAMVALACGFILYDTSNVLYHYRTDQHVAAALALFASIALLFWYILRILLASSSRD